MVTKSRSAETVQGRCENYQAEHLPLVVKMHPGDTAAFDVTDWFDRFGSGMLTLTVTGERIEPARIPLEIVGNYGYLNHADLSGIRPGQYPAQLSYRTSRGTYYSHIIELYILATHDDGVYRLGAAARRRAKAKKNREDLQEGA